jgi:two-component system response regulator RegX3
MMPAKILIVDDEPDILRMLCGILGPDFNVLEATNGLQALGLLQREHPRLILLDLMMPDMSGMEVLEAALRAVPSVIVMMLTGVDDVDAAVLALNEGARAYVTKPFDPEYLRTEVGRLLEPGAAPDDPPWRVKNA